ncbi:hypothetical protein SAMN04488057_105178 [Cyclobacterium lianum]|uniref:Uncharacterized protein n=1 Tax=Cyclobacterium lianum TaxID=388280 RepID=A0A1M7NCD6_9BACT|nr:hypothetical protein [Cyclobacterium lianum]SHN00816.1 hypothetical protein SAMN04488057_105178 [Cyclobacterium lianum]
MNSKELSLLLSEDIFVIRDEITEKIAADEMALRMKLAAENVDLVEESPIEPESATERDPEPIQYEGSFQKSILVIHQGETLPEQSRDFLFKVFRAVNLSLRDIALVSEKALKDSNEDPLAQLEPNKMILFGSLHHPLMKMKKDNYHISQEPVEYFFADELEELENNEGLKRKLWNTLQVFFNIKKQ